MPPQSTSFELLAHMSELLIVSSVSIDSAILAWLCMRLDFLFFVMVIHHYARWLFMHFAAKLIAGGT